MNHSFFQPEKQYGEGLPTFEQEWEAIAFYYDYRQSQLEELSELCQFHNISLTYTRESLEELEHLYFQSIQELLLADWELPIEEFEKMISIYIIDCAIKHHHDAEWVVAPYPYTDGAYTMGYRRGNKTWHTANCCENLYLRKKEHQPLLALFDSLIR
ncbi:MULTISPECIES: hypothetical protein [Bacillus]|uniref:hypothetical protein n=1 Tax=Bacillus TaxID=1386 RepID=UPI000779D824|nr:MULTISPECIES: hypothetical protein [Bacillus]ATO27295.1 hypothetical protein RA13_04065 [Bacillus atrophaeus]KYD06567.1 hypothetical protein B4144_3867 [Bacillus atrophaeus]MCI3195493.1 hypothetical protein [Bacillus sp. HU-1818]MCY8516920.1 hypothetical protein [Bacillus atrophaeus]MCY8520814.1 hypothetical protein [Bacillus atrophaeus]